MEHCLERDVYLGSPATTQREQMQIMAVQRRLPEMRREVKQLRRDIDQLQQSVDQKRVA
jgi:UDP-3-O-[3-hydroxymyristoyl] glucosamine N-acyltransferase